MQWTTRRRSISTTPARERGTVHLVIIDYVQLLAQVLAEQETGIDPMNATRDYGEGALKNRAIQPSIGRGLVVVALSQLSRAAYMAAREAVKNSREADPYQSVLQCNEL